MSLLDAVLIALAALLIGLFIAYFGPPWMDRIWSWLFRGQP